MAHLAKQIKNQPLVSKMKGRPFYTHLAFWLCSLMLLACLARLWQLGTIPMTLNRDEAALAYNAFLLKQTGKDEWGQSWPLQLQSFGDYKLLGYVTAVIASFSIFGFQDMAVRLPSALAGIGLIPLVFLFSRRVLRQSQLFSLLAASILSITPVFFFYSHLAFEANLGLFLTVAAVTLIFGSFESRARADILGVLIFVLAVGTYNTPLLLLPFFILALVFWRGARKIKQWLLPVSLMGVIFVSGMVLFSTVNQQKKGITLFSDETTWKKSVDFRSQLSSPWAKTIVGNRVVFYTLEISDRIIRSMSPDFLVIKGGTHPWHSVPKTGHLYWVTYLLMLFGIGTCVYKRDKSSKLLLFFLLISLAPAAITVDAPHATRSLFFFWISIFMSALGWRSLLLLLEKSQTKTVGAVVTMIVVGLLAVESGRYLWRFYNTYPKEVVGLQTEYSEFIQQTNKQLQDRDRTTDRVAVEDDSGYLYILTAWYIKLDPELYFRTVVMQQPDKIGFRFGEQVGQYHFIAHTSDRSEAEKVLIWKENQVTWRVDGL